jgi:hypothetical protein
LEALCRRDATLITHAATCMRFAERQERKEMSRADALAGAIRHAEREDDRQTRDNQAVLSLLDAYRQDHEIDIHDTAFATWKRQSIEKFKAFYRLHFSRTERPRKQPTRKSDWIGIIYPKLHTVVMDG